jgi:hypothetical protein
MEVKCAYVDQLADALYHKWLPPTLAKDFESHIALCPDCQGQLKRYELELQQRVLRVLSDDAEDPEVVEELWARFLLKGKVVIPQPKSSS